VKPHQTADGPGSPRMLALTFDDGPDPRGTPAVLDALRAANAGATFFVLAERAAAHPELLAAILAAGHTVELHGHAHLRHPRSTGRTIEDDLDRALETLAEHGVTPRRWRVPWGDLAAFTPTLAATRGLRLTGWTTDTRDWRGDAAPDMLARLDLTPGAIVLAHDGIGPGAQRNDAAQTARLIGPLVAAARARGLAPGPLADPWPVPIPFGNPDFG